jgi:hypothetical protein
MREPPEMTAIRVSGFNGGRAITSEVRPRRFYDFGEDNPSSEVSDDYLYCNSKTKSPGVESTTYGK